MKAVNGYLENGRFTPLEVITLPRRVQAVLVYDETAVDEGRDARLAFLREFRELAREAAGEEMPDFPRMRFDRALVDLSDGEVVS